MGTVDNVAGAVRRLSAGEAGESWVKSMPHIPDGGLVGVGDAFTDWNRLEGNRIFAPWECVTNVVVHAYTFSAASC